MEKGRVGNSISRGKKYCIVVTKSLIEVKIKAKLELL